MCLGGNCGYLSDATWLNSSQFFLLLRILVKCTHSLTFENTLLTFTQYTFTIIYIHKSEFICEQNENMLFVSFNLFTWKHFVSYFRSWIKLILFEKHLEIYEMKKSHLQMMTVPRRIIPEALLFHWKDITFYFYLTETFSLL